MNSAPKQLNTLHSTHVCRDERAVAVAYEGQSRQYALGGAAR
jgi:hypothetical protein